MTANNKSVATTILLLFLLMDWCLGRRTFTAWLFFYLLWGHRSSACGWVGWPDHFFGGFCLRKLACLYCPTKKAYCRFSSCCVWWPPTTKKVLPLLLLFLLMGWCLGRWTFTAWLFFYDIYIFCLMIWGFIRCRLVCLSCLSLLLLCHQHSNQIVVSEDDFICVLSVRVCVQSRAEQSRLYNERSPWAMDGLSDHQQGGGDAYWRDGIDGSTAVKTTCI